jgi:hypothetical protein
MPSPYWQTFIESYFGGSYIVWHDGPDEHALLSLVGEERNEAERMLIDALGSADPRPVEGLLALRSIKALPRLKEVLPHAYHTTLAAVALALWKLDRYPPAVDALIDLLRTNPNPDNRRDIAVAMSEIRVQPIVVALFDAAQNDPEPIVRSQAVASLLCICQIEPSPLNMHPLTGAVYSTDKTRREKAIQDLRDLISNEGTLTISVQIWGTTKP